MKIKGQKANALLRTKGCKCNVAVAIAIGDTLRHAAAPLTRVPQGKAGCNLPPDKTFKEADGIHSKVHIATSCNLCRITTINYKELQNIFRSELQWTSTASPPQKSSNSSIGHWHDDVILLLRPKSFRGLLSCTNEGFCYFKPHWDYQILV